MMSLRESLSCVPAYTLAMSLASSAFWLSVSSASSHLSMLRFAHCLSAIFYDDDDDAYDEVHDDDDGFEDYSDDGLISVSSSG